MISIIVITFNRAEYLKTTLQSILSQSFKEIEVIVVDDGSTDSTRNVVESFGDNRMKYLNFGKLGNLSKLRNLGIRNSSGNLIAFCDDDDIWRSDRLEFQLDLIENYPLVCSNALVIDANGNLIADKYFNDVDSDFEIDLKYLLSNGNCILTSTVLARRTLFESSNKYFDEINHTNFCEDFELFLRQVEGTHFYFANEPLVSKRTHESVSGGLNNNIKMLEKSIQILDEYGINHKKKSIELQSTEGILGYRILLNKLHYRRSLSSGVRNSLEFFLYLLRPSVFAVFLKKKVLRKVKSLVG